MKAIIGIFVMLLLASGVFAVSVPIENIADSPYLASAVSVSDVSTGEIDAEQVSDVLVDLERVKDPKLKRLGFIKTWYGQGWAEDDKNGRLINAFWAAQVLASVDELSASSEPEYTVTRTFGRIHISGEGMYKLVRYYGEDSEKYINFHIVPLNTVVDSEDAEDHAVGSISVTLEKVMGDFSTWTGTLKMDSGTLSGEGDVELGVIFKKIGQNNAGRGKGNIQNIRDTTLVNAIATPSMGKPVEGSEDNQAIKAERFETKETRKSIWSFLRFWRN